MLLADKVIIVTGAGGGLGEGIARVCHREGARVVVADIRGDAASKVAESPGEAALAATCDVGDDQARSGLVDASIAEFGRIDGLVNKMRASISSEPSWRPRSRTGRGSSVWTCAPCFS